MSCRKRFFGLLIGHMSKPYLPRWRNSASEYWAAVSLNHRTIEDLTRVTSDVIAEVRRTGITHPSVVDALGV